MLSVYRQKEAPVCLDSAARLLFSEGVEAFDSFKLNERVILEYGNSVYVFPWMGDRVTFTIAILLRRAGLRADCYGRVINVDNASVVLFRGALDSVLAERQPTETELTHIIPNTITDKYDYYLPKDIQDIGYGAKYFDIDGALGILRDWEI
jgi:ATP-dependent Lhr-like helicase